jgi:hypothetical protein
MAVIIDDELANRISELHRRVAALESGAFWRSILPATPPRGCVCPPTAELTCRGLGCPRQGATLGQ